MPFERKPLWYKDAIIYELHVKTFLDSDGTGMGDFRGLISKLDYIRDLGVNTLWLLPFYPSPLRDDGYDIADYHRVNPAFGTVELFREFLAEAHARDLHVITEVVINHTSDQHPWFQRARRAPAGSPERDFYVWSQTKEKYGQARIIFTDTEPSNWTWDPIAKSHYWHRFFSHQPDLNFDNPAVHEAVFEILDYWLGMGVDGLRLDAIPYLYEREGTNCENLPETHAFLRKLAEHVHSRFDNRILLAEANQWPEDAAEYFGNPVIDPSDAVQGATTGRACDMAFHFPLMTRLYMAVEMEDRFPVVDILEQTPPIPPHCQWAIFLRNHDELTLEMVTDEERDYMYRVFAKDRRARLNVGIRRRLAPLLGNNRRKIELMNKLLLSMPGTPVLYYGDEIGMGDNYYLGDRDGVRTPMQWNADRNAGFSRAPSQQLYLPVIADAEFHYVSVNVELQESVPDSLLWWMRRQIRLRQAHPVFGRGSIRFPEINNNHVLAYVRESEDEAVLVVANLSQYPQTARIDLAGFRGAEPVELSGGQKFSLVTDEAYPVMLGAHDCYWIQLRGRVEDLSREIRSLPDAGDWDSLAALARAGLPHHALSSFVVQAPWFEGKARVLIWVHTLQVVDTGEPNPPGVLWVLRAAFLNGDPEDYGIWLGFIEEAGAETLPSQALVARARIQGKAGYLCEAQYLPDFQVYLASRLLEPSEGANPANPSVSRVEETEVPALPAHFTAQLVEGYPEEFRIRVRDRVVLRWFRRLREGARPDLEILKALNGVPGSRSLHGARARALKGARVPVPVTEMTYRLPASTEPQTVGYAQRFVPADRTALDLAQENLKRYLESVATSGSPPATEGSAQRVPPRIDFQTLPTSVQESMGGSWAEFVFLLGQRLAEIHRRLAKITDDPAFTPEHFSLMYQHALYHSVRSRVRRGMSFLKASLEKDPSTVPESLRETAAAVLRSQAGVLSGLQRLTARRMNGWRFRIHGDPNLDRILFTGKDFVFTSFDGAPWLAPAEKRLKLCPLHDVAAVMAELESLAGAGTAEENWARLSAGLFLDGYLDAIEGSGIVPAPEEDVRLLLEIFLVERAAYSLRLLPAAGSAPSPKNLWAFRYLARYFPSAENLNPS